MAFAHAVALSRIPSLVAAKKGRLRCGIPCRAVRRRTVELPFPAGHLVDRLPERR